MALALSSYGGAGVHIYPSAQTLGLSETLIQTHRAVWITTQHANIFEAR